MTKMNKRKKYVYFFFLMCSRRSRRRKEKKETWEANGHYSLFKSFPACAICSSFEFMMRKRNETEQQPNTHASISFSWFSLRYVTTPSLFKERKMFLCYPHFPICISSMFSGYSSNRWTRII